MGTITDSESSSDNDIATLNPLRYRGYVYDDETGLYYLQTRYYDPETGRFLNADVYCDTQTGTALSTNMFAYCENNTVMGTDTAGTDAWWLQDSKAVHGFGHTSLLIQEKPGRWWYFYWGDTSIQLLFIGTSTQKELNQKVRNVINRYNKECGFNILYQEDYTKTIRLTGDFTSSLQYINRYMNSYSRKYNSKIFKLRVSAESGAVRKLLKDSAHMYYKNKLRPQSMVIRGNKAYDLFKWNCMQVSSAALSYGKLKGVNKNRFQSQIGILGLCVIPNIAYIVLRTLNFGKQVLT